MIGPYFSNLMQVSKLIRYRKERWIGVPDTLPPQTPGPVAGRRAEAASVTLAAAAGAMPNALFLKGGTRPDLPLSAIKDI